MCKSNERNKLLSHVYYGSIINGRLMLPHHEISSASQVKEKRVIYIFRKINLHQGFRRLAHRMRNPWLGTRTKIFVTHLSFKQHW